MTSTPDLDPRALAELAALGRQANRDALNDPGTLAHYLTGTFQHRAHTRRISQEFVNLQRGENRRIMILQPPQTGKSTLAAMWGPFWWLCHHPHHKIIIASYGQQLAIGRGRAIRKMVQEHGWRYGLAIAQGSGSVAEWETTQGGGVKAVGFGSSVTGFSADALFLDDPHKNRQEAESVVIRDRVWDSYSADLISRLQPRSPVALLYTPWHVDDLGHRIMQQEGVQGSDENPGAWRVLRMPAFADTTTDPLGREPGDPLTHPKIPEDDRTFAVEHWQGRRAQTSVRDWHALYQCDPRPSEGALVTPELMRARRHFPPAAIPVKHAVAVDPSGGGRDNAGVIGGFLGDDNRLYVTHDRTVVGYSDKWGDEAALLAAETNADYLIIEYNYGGTMARTAFRSAWDAIKRMSEGHALPTDDEELVARARALPHGVPALVPQIVLVQAKKGKLLRAEPIAQQWHDDRMRTGSYLPELENEWCVWMPTDPDSPGRIDASVYLAYQLLPIPGADTMISTPAGSGARVGQLPLNPQRPRLQQPRFRPR